MLQSATVVFCKKNLQTKQALSFQKFSPKTSHRILRHMHGALNVDETKKLIAQFTVKSRDKSFKPN
jgi:hypothetical protein